MNWISILGLVPDEFVFVTDDPVGLPATAFPSVQRKWRILMSDDPGLI